MKLRKRKDVQQQRHYQKTESANRLASYVAHVTASSTPADLFAETTLCVEAIQSMDARTLPCTEDTSLYPTFETTARLYGYKTLVGLSRSNPCSSTSSLVGVSTSNAQARRRRGTGTKVRGRCLQTNRTRSVNRVLKLSRQQVRRLAVKRSIPGVTQST